MQKSTKRKLKNVLITLAFPVAIWVIMEVLCAVTVGRHVIASMLDIQNLVRNAGITVCSALALSYSLGNGRFDLSVGAQRMAAAILGGNLAMSLGLGSIGVLLFALVFGIVFGGLVGVIFVTTRIPAMVLGIGMALIFECVAFVGSNSLGLQIYGVENVKNLSNMYLCIVVVLIASFVAFFLDRYTKFGYHNRAIHSSQKIANDCGINIFSHTVFCYILAGAVVALSGVLDAAFKGVMDAELGFSSSSTVLSCCFPMFLGKFISRWSNSDALGIIVASVTIRLYQTGFSVMKFSITAQQVVLGAAFLVFLIVRANQFYFKKVHAKNIRIAQAIEKRAAMTETA